MNVLAEKFCEWAKSNGWNIELSKEECGLPKEVSERYKFIPENWLEFIRCFEVCANGGDNIWFLTPCDYENNGAFRWNEFEHICLDAAADDTAWQNSIRAFWDNYIPIVMSTAGGYHYYAVGVKTGEIFEGREPEFEELEICAPSFTDFVENIISGKIILN